MTLVESFPSAFRQVADVALDWSAVERERGLRVLISDVLPLLGYDGQATAGHLPLVVAHEDRLLPLLLIHRTPSSPPLIQFHVSKGIATLLAFGPVGRDRTVAYARLTLDCTGQIGDPAAVLATDLISTTHRGIAVGVHSAEKFLRSSDPRHHRSLTLPDEAAHVLRSDVIRNVRRCDTLAVLFPALKPFTLVVGHDCYGQAIDVNLALGMQAPVVLVPKGKPCHFYPAGSAPGKWSDDGGVFSSHLGRWFSGQLTSRWNSVAPPILDDARRLMAERLENLAALPYMNVNYRDSGSDSMAGWENFRNSLGLPVYDPGQPTGDASAHWIFALHSFSDEAFRWGMDRLWSMYDMFLRAARHIQAAFPADRIVLRPHPNTLDVFVGPRHGWALRKAFERMHAGDRLDMPTRYFDVSLQLGLCREIADTGVECFLSPMVPAGELLRPQASIVLTRHGNIVLEAAWLGRRSVFSEVAPYAFLFPPASRFSDAESLRRAMDRARAETLAGLIEGPSREDLARYQAILDTPYGSSRTASAGMVLEPTSTHEPMQSFDDFTYPAESVSEAVERLLACLSAPQEVAAFRDALGLTP